MDDYVQSSENKLASQAVKSVKHSAKIHEVLPQNPPVFNSNLRGKPGATKASEGGAGWTHNYFYPEILHSMSPSILSSRTLEDRRSLWDFLKTSGTSFEQSGAAEICPSLVNG